MTCTRNVILFLYSLLCVSFVFSQQAIPPEKPKLIIAIVVDQMRYDYILKYWKKISDKGFKRLIDEGAFCKNTHYNYQFTQTGPGHATIFTGANPCRHGIVSNDWYIRISDKIVRCTEDLKTNTIGSESTNGQHSPRQLLVPTVGDQLKLSNKGQSKVFGISLKERAAIFPAGHMANAAYWYDQKTGRFITSSYYLDSLPVWVEEFNAKKYSDQYLDRVWNTLLPIDQYTESIPDSNSFEKGFSGNQIEFPYNLAMLSMENKKIRKYDMIQYTPFGNTMVTDFAISLMINENMGKDPLTDILSISYSATDYIGHHFGPSSVEIEDTYLRLDNEIAHLLEFINDNYKKENVLLFLTSDHGVCDIPAYRDSLKLPGGVFKHNYVIALLESYLNAVYGEGKWISRYSGQQIYLNHKLIEDSNKPLLEMQEKVAQFIIQFNGVENAMTSHTLQTSNFTDGVFSYMQNSFNQKRSGDVIINLQPGWIEDIYDATTHNSPYNYDTHVPLIWFGWKIIRGNITRPISITDIVPTLCIFLDIMYPDGVSGEPVRELIK